MVKPLHGRKTMTSLTLEERSKFKKADPALYVKIGRMLCNNITHCYVHVYNVQYLNNFFLDFVNSLWIVSSIKQELEYEAQHDFIKMSKSKAMYWCLSDLIPNGRDSDILPLFGEVVTKN